MFASSVEHPASRRSVGARSAAVLALLAACWLSACGDQAAPTASVEPAFKKPVFQPNSEILSTVDASTVDIDCAVRIIGERDVRTVHGEIGPCGGEIVMDATGGRPQDNMRITFTVPPGALDEIIPITMVVHGDLLSELVTEFSPSGLLFSPWATLHHHLGTERVDVDPATLTAVHIYSDGTEVEVDSAVNHVGSSKSVQIWVDVPGFSRYGLRTSR